MIPSAHIDLHGWFERSTASQFAYLNNLVEAGLPILQFMVGTTVMGGPVRYCRESDKNCETALKVIAGTTFVCTVFVVTWMTVGMILR